MEEMVIIKMGITKTFKMSKINKIKKKIRMGKVKTTKTIK